MPTPRCAGDTERSPRTRIAHLAFLFGFAGLFFNPLLIFIALFVFLGAQQKATQAQMKELSGQLRVADAMITQLTTLPAGATLNDAVEALLRTSQHEFPVGELMLVRSLRRPPKLPSWRPPRPQATA